MFLCGVALWGSMTARADKPNLVVILADDLGFSDLGCYGGEIKTPHLDLLARQGIRFTQFYNTARCWPSRAALLTGYYAQQVRRDTLPGIPSGSQGVRPAWARLLPEMLKPLGYYSYHSGKWHLDGTPLNNGFEHSYRLEDHDRNFNPKVHYEDDRLLPAVSPGSGYYTSTAIANHAIQCLANHQTEHAREPFFSFIAFTSPHFPLQAPEEDIARYRDRYTDGWESLRLKRWDRLQSMGIVNGELSPVERETGPPYPFPEALKTLGTNEVNRPVFWERLSSSQRRFQADKMAIHAAMVDRMDREIGRILDQIRAMKQWENTLILFLSDNGASAEMMIRGDGHDPEAQCGTAATFLSLGPGWSTMANTPFRKHKTWVHEGGISTPLIAHWPRGITSYGELRHSAAHLVDLVPTLLEIAGGRAFDTWQGEPVPTPPGISLVSLLSRDEVRQRPPLWWCHEKNRALRVGDWKIVTSGEGQPWELYHISVDRGETRDLSKLMPDKVKELSSIWSAMTARFEQTARSRP